MGAGVIFDLAGRYGDAFINGIAWNVMNFVIMLWLLKKSKTAQPEPRRRGESSAAIGGTLKSDASADRW